MLNVLCWKWHSPTYRTKYTADHVNILRASFARNYAGEHRFICVTDDPIGVDCETFPLWSDCEKLVNPNGAHFPSCFRRLKMFDAETLQSMGIAAGQRVLSIDLDVVVVQDVAPMFDRPENFVGWIGVGAHNPVVYNGTLIMHRAGTMQRLWDEFDPIASPVAAKRARYFGSDQGYLSHKLNGSVPGWDRPEMLSFHRDIKSKTLPRGARMVSFNGKIKPWDVEAKSYPWVLQNWRA